jgi:hypothetical protein
MFTPKPPAAKIDSNSSQGKADLAKIALSRAIQGRKEPFTQAPSMPTFKK